MADVQSVVTKFDALMGVGHDEFLSDKKIALLDMAKDEVWKVLVGSSAQENWFVDSSQSTSSGQNDYFAPLVVTAREFFLPPDFHQMRTVEVTTASKENIRFVKGRLHDEDFRRERASQQSFQNEVLFDIIGPAPGKLFLSLFAPSALALRLWYIQHPTAWAALGSSADEFPTSYHGFIAEWAVMRGILGLGDPRFQAFTMQWSERLERQLTTYNRDSSGVEVVEGFMEG